MDETTPDATDLNCESYSATYCPEDDKIRIYCGRVKRPTYDWLRSLGFSSTPKQGCDFVAVWGPSREDAALAMIDEGDDIGDEDQTPEDRAADRAERFGNYRNKRRAEAGGLADRYDGSPDAYGHQNAGRAERQASRRDRVGVRACSQWSKAEYWQVRTGGVIAHALHKARPGVRRGRIVRLETERRRCADGSRWSAHIDLRIAYERQMIEADGGAAFDVEMVPGGRLGKWLILRVHRSNATKQVVSVTVYAPDTEVWGRKVDMQKINVQRLSESVYTPPTDEDLASLARVKATMTEKTQARNAGAPKLINPTDEDAQRLQDAWNEGKEKTAELVRMTQAAYSLCSRGDYSPADTVFVGPDYKPTYVQYRGNVADGAAFKVRRFKPSNWCGAYRVVVITDKPQKAMQAMPTATHEPAPLETQVKAPARLFVD